MKAFLDVDGAFSSGNLIHDENLKLKKKKIKISLRSAGSITDLWSESGR